MLEINIGVLSEQHSTKNVGVRLRHGTTGCVGQRTCPQGFSPLGRRGVEHVGIDHGRLDISMSQQLLNRPLAAAVC